MRSQTEGVRRMLPQTKKNRFSAYGMPVVCLLAVLLSLYSIFSTNQLRQTTSLIYDHPYTVSNEARAMRSRLLDMRGFLPTIFNDPHQSVEGAQALLKERYSMQYASIGIITERYLGPAEDTDALSAAMQALEQTQDAALPALIDLTGDETVQYIEAELYPRYDAVDEALSSVITFADQKVQGLERAAADTSRRSLLSAVLLTIFLPSYFLVVFWRERKGMREIRYREHLFDILTTNVDDMFFIYSAQSNALEYVSANTRRILGMEDTVFQTDPQALRELVAEEDLEAFDQFVHSGNRDTSQEVSLRMRFPTGEIRWVHIHLYPELVRDRAVRYIITVSDRTETMRTQQVLKDALVNAQNANAAKQSFLSRMSHEIRTPMNAIIGMTTIAAAYIEDRKRVEDCLEKIGYSSKHLMTLINDVLDMSKIDEGKMTIAHETFNLESVAESVTSIIYPQAAAKSLDFTMPLVDLTDTVLVGDSMRLNQVLLNLLSNALKFTPEGGSVRLEIRQLQKKNGRVRLRFTVSDTGIGMSGAFMERLFLPFEQESAATGQRYGGTGLGMSITKNLVTLMGGTISVQSAPEQGSSFTVELDFDVPEEDGAPQPHRQQALESLKVLVADDDRDSCIHTSLLLQNLGITSDWVLTGLECVDRVLLAHRTGEDYDVCFVDWKMPDIDGVEVTRRVREYVGPDTTIIIITAYDWSAIEQSAREAGANAFLSKPIFASTLYNALLAVTGVDKAVRERPDQAAWPRLEGRRVLLAEDNALNCEIAVELLKMVGVQVDWAQNGQEAVDKFLADGSRYDLILMDVQMPVLDGYRATEAIRSSGHPRAKDIPILAMTADAFHEDVVKAAQAGMNGHLAKPIDRDRLFARMTELLSGGQGKP